MKIGLDSDFYDYYDHWFDRGEVDFSLNRQSRNDMGKQRQFELCKEIGFQVPRHGLAQTLYMRNSSDWLVVYEDPFAHCGEGKFLIQSSKAFVSYPDHYASEFIPTTANPLTHAVSYRLLLIGYTAFQLKYESDAWMSNHAKNVSIELTGLICSREHIGESCFQEIGSDIDFSIINKYSLIAFDYVTDFSTGKSYVVDLNTAPGLKGTGIDDLVKPQEVFSMIKSYAENL